MCFQSDMIGLWKGWLDHWGAPPQGFIQLITACSEKRCFAIVQLVIFANCNARRLYSKLVYLWGHLVFLIPPATHKTGFVLTERCRLSDLIHLRLSETCNHVYYKLVSKRCTKGSSINSPAPWVTYTYGNTAFSINKDARASIYKINVVMVDNEMDK